MKLLILNTAGIGDFIELIPWLYFAKKQKKFEISVIVSDRVYEYAKTCPYIDEVLYLRSYQNHIKKFSIHNILVFGCIRNSYDVILNTYPPLTFFSKLLWKISLFLLKNKRSKIVEYSKTIYDNHYKYYEKVFKKIEVYKNDFNEIFWFKDETINKLDTIISFKDNKKVVGINVFGNTLTKKWDKNKWRELIQKINILYGLNFFIFSTKKDIEYVRDIYNTVKSDNVIFLSGLMIEEWIYFIKKCSFVISVDSAIMHISSILKIPSVIISGPVDPIKTKPFFNSDYVRFVYKKVKCSPCEYYICPNTGENNMLCMKIITVDDILSRFSEIYEENN